MKLSITTYRLYDPGDCPPVYYIAQVDDDPVVWADTEDQAARALWASLRGRRVIYSPRTSQPAERTGIIIDIDELLDNGGILDAWILVSWDDDPAALAVENAFYLGLEEVDDRHW